MRKIIILERLNAPSDFSFKFACWVDVPQGMESLHLKPEDPKNPDKVTVVPDATDEEIQAIREGRVVEFVSSAIFPTHRVTQDARKKGDMPDGVNVYDGPDVEQVKEEVTFDDIKEYAKQQFDTFQAEISGKGHENFLISFDEKGQWSK